MTNKKLIRGLKQGDKKCFDEIFEMYYDRSFAYAMSLLKNGAATEDVIQNVFLKIWLGRKTIDLSKDFDNYVLTAVRNEAISYLRLKYNNSKVNGEIPDVEDIHADIMANVIYSETNSRIRELIEKMPPQRRRVFEMNRYENKSAKEIAKEMNLSPRTVERHIALAMLDLRKGMTKQTYN